MYTEDGDLKLKEHPKILAHKSRASVAFFLLPN